MRRQKILIWSALTAIFIACMGLFGLATYASEQRIKEIGVRKVLGASVSSIATLLSEDFIKLVIISIVVASPIALFINEQMVAGICLPYRNKMVDVFAGSHYRHLCLLWQQ